MSHPDSLSCHIDRHLAQRAPGDGIVIALSGGLDSCLLLALANEAAQRHAVALRALHVHHGLQAAADDFEAHCRRLCAELEVALEVVRVTVEPDGHGPEAAAREARYAALIAHSEVHETIWLAQHANDQAETFLLSALRGSGVRGLAAMMSERQHAERRLQRPLLGFSRAELEAAARQRGLDWCEDPSNRHTGLDRNYLRHAVMAPLSARWPNAARALSRSAEWLGEADELLAELAAIDLAHVGGRAERLQRAGLMALSLPRQRLLIRYALDCRQLPHPPAARMAELLRQLAAARHDATPCIAWPGVEAHLWRGHLYLEAPPAPPFADWQREWDGVAPLMTPCGAVNVRLLSDNGTGCPGRLTVRPRCGGEHLRLAGRGRRDVKRVLQEAGVPPWRRAQVLVVYAGDEVVALLGPLALAATGWRLKQT
ncbi:tRNA lysidine(34) synthetase TilS [Kushneria aurantia]|uniref:tRNA(Ile)-lysidine synthase n=1 Tax=Kushneria aurantia TaxID=504092 RepID=A0ABV6G5H8_9GAMM|nr:tRNA lysidine(34) synthetase TilS [Kushneria aurantia]